MTEEPETRSEGADTGPRSDGAGPGQEPDSGSGRDMGGRLPDPVARLLAQGRARFREHVPPGWSWRRVVVGLVLGEAAAVLLLLLFLALTGQELVVSFRRPAGESPAGLTIPVAGVTAAELDDTWGAPRTADRTHRGIDIRAPAGTPVVAAAPGVIVRLDSNRRGGTTIHQRGLDGRTVYYYAHLQRRAPGLEVSDRVRQGDTIAFVGDSGNARGIPHLHFAVYAVSDPNDVSDGRHMNPYALLVESPPEPGTR
jgi:murein DD-endopeptidase MepM/ murein hydrolase activator NlpD